MISNLEIMVGEKNIGTGQKKTYTLSQLKLDLKNTIDKTLQTRMPTLITYSTQF